MLSVSWFIWISLRFFCFVSVISSSGWPNLDACIGKQQIIFMNRLQICVFFFFLIGTDLVSFDVDYWCIHHLMRTYGFWSFKEFSNKFLVEKVGYVLQFFPSLKSVLEIWFGTKDLYRDFEEWLDIFGLLVFFIFSIFFFKDFSTLSSSFRGDSSYFKSWFWKFIFNFVRRWNVWLLFETLFFSRIRSNSRRLACPIWNFDSDNIWIDGADELATGPGG